MAMQENRPNIVVDENFLMLEKRLRRRHQERADVYSNADAMEQERSGARTYAIAPEAYGSSKFIGGISSFQNGADGKLKYMTTEDYVAYFEMCHDTFGAMNPGNVTPAKNKGEDSPKVLVNRKQVEEIRKSMSKASAKRGAKKPAAKDAAKPIEQNAKIESGKLDAFFKKLSSVKGRAVASVAAVAICYTVAIGGFVANDPSGSANDGALDRVRMVEPASDPTVDADEDAHGNLLSTLE